LETEIQRVKRQIAQAADDPERQKNLRQRLKRLEQALAREKEKADR